MTAARKPAATRKTTTKKPALPEGAVSVADLPDLKAAQISEAMQETIPFVMKSGRVFTFKPLTEWSYKANVAFARGDIVTWLRGVLADPSELDDLLDSPSPEVGRIIQYYDDMAGATRGEGSSSSTS